MFSKLCKKLLLSIITLLCCYCIFNNFAIISSAKSEVDTTIGVERVEAPNEVIEFIVDKAVEIVSDVLDDPTYLGISDFSTNDIQVMDPYILFLKQNDGSFKENDIYYFPVISNQKVLFTIDVFMTPEGYNYSVANELGEILTKFIDNDDCMRLYVDNGERFNKCEYQYYSIESDVNHIQNEENLRSRGIITEEKLNVLLDIDLEDNNQYQSNYKEKISSPIQGFSVSDNTTKRLDMTNYLVAQGDYLSTIPYIAPIYRFGIPTQSMTFNGTPYSFSSGGKCLIK